MLTRPDPSEYPSPYQRYIDLVPEGDLMRILQVNRNATLELLTYLPFDKWDERYAEGKWTLKEVFGHIIENEIHMHYRIFRISKGDTAPLFGYDQDAYIAAGAYNSYTTFQMLDYYKQIRELTLLTYHGIRSDDWVRGGSIGGNPFTARALAYISAGHETHHMKIIKEKYL